MPGRSHFGFYPSAATDDVKNNDYCSTSPSSNSNKSDQYNRKKLFAITGDHSPLWTTLTHAQTITEFIES